MIQRGDLYDPLILYERQFTAFHIVSKTFFKWCILLYRMAMPTNAINKEKLNNSIWSLPLLVFLFRISDAMQTFLYTNNSRLILLLVFHGSIFIFFLKYIYTFTYFYCNMALSIDSLTAFLNFTSSTVTDKSELSKNNVFSTCVTQCLR